MSFAHNAVPGSAGHFHACYQLVTSEYLPLVAPVPPL